MGLFTGICAVENDGRGDHNVTHCFGLLWRGYGDWLTAAPAGGQRNDLGLPLWPLIGINSSWVD